MESEPLLTIASLIHHVTTDLLTQHGLDASNYPEIIDLGAIITGLGLPRSQISLVQKGGPFWDTTYWMEMPRPFLDVHGMAYAFAVAAWFRGEKNPSWFEELETDVRKPAQKSLKYLDKTQDSFLAPNHDKSHKLDQAQPEWLKAAMSNSVTSQIIAVRHLHQDQSTEAQQAQVLADQLRSSHQPVVVNAITTIERLGASSNEVVDELRFLIEHRDDEVRAKAMIALSKLGHTDEASLIRACKMIDAPVNFVAFAGLVALSRIEKATEDVLRATERGFKRSLQTCNYEFVNLYAATFDRWLDDPESHFQQMLAHDQPEYLQIALDALASTREPSVTAEKQAS